MEIIENDTHKTDRLQKEIIKIIKNNKFDYVLSNVFGIIYVKERNKSDIKKVIKQTIKIEQIDYFCKIRILNTDLIIDEIKNESFTKLISKEIEKQIPELNIKLVFDSKIIQNGNTKIR